MRRAAGTRLGARAMSHTLPRLDAAVARLFHGRHSATSLTTGLSVLELTTTGRRSGSPRTSHLIAIPFREDLALIGTNFGQSTTPAWALNLKSDSRCALTFRARTVQVVARPATAAECDEVFAAASTHYVGYRHYRARIGGSRRVRVFVLEPPPRP